jgi:hypothetical protein
MEFSESIEAQFNDAIEAAYIMMDPNADRDERKQAKRNYERLAEIFTAMAREEWWDKECDKFPSCPQCLCYDL